MHRDYPIRTDYAFDGRRGFPLIWSVRARLGERREREDAKERRREGTGDRSTGVGEPGAVQGCPLPPFSRLRSFASSRSPSLKPDCREMTMPQTLFEKIWNA